MEDRSLDRAGRLERNTLQLLLVGVSTDRCLRDTKALRDCAHRSVLITEPEDERPNMSHIYPVAREWSAQGMAYPHVVSLSEDEGIAAALGSADERHSGPAGPL
jgi:hypothetical protein